MLDGSGLKKLVDISQRHLGVLYVTCGKKGRAWMAVENVIRGKDQGLSDCLKTTEVNSDKGVNVLVKEN